MLTPAILPETGRIVEGGSILFPPVQVQRSALEEELYKLKANGDPSVLDCTQTDTEDNHPILRKEVEAAVQSLKKGKSA